MMINQMTNKHKLSPWGLEDGCAGLPGATLYQAAGTTEWKTIPEAFGKISPSKYSNVPVKPGDRVRVQAPGGGGFGDPRERDRAQVIDDVREGYVTLDQAKALYGFDESWL
jgi:5-oxoprolinase (ATP-hydrolysing)/N-methylhydantoinase B